MPTTSVTRATPKKKAAPKKTHPKAIIATTGGIKCVLPFAPREVDHGGWADEWSTLARAGRRPLVVRTAEGLPTLGFTVLLGSWDHQRSVEPLIDALRKIARSGQQCYVSLGPSERGSWVLSSIGVRSLARQHMTNAITRAEVDLGFTAASSASMKLGPISQGAKPKPKPKPKAKPSAGRWYTVRRGDTLSGIARRTLGDADDWRKIANASQNKGKLRNPNRIAVGLRLWVPG